MKCRSSANRFRKEPFLIPKREQAQVTTEYVIMLLMVLLIVFSLTALMDAVCRQGERMVEVASFNVP